MSLSGLYFLDRCMGGLCLYPSIDAWHRWLLRREELWADTRERSVAVESSSLLYLWTRIQSAHNACHQVKGGLLSNDIET